MTKNGGDRICSLANMAEYNVWQHHLLAAKPTRLLS